MPRASHVKLPKKCLANGFTKDQQLLVIKSWLIQINSKVRKSHTLKLKIPGFGTIKTHGNKKSSKEKYQKIYNKKLWKEQKKRIEFSEKHLLF